MSAEENRAQAQPESPQEISHDRREFLKQCAAAAPLLLAAISMAEGAAASTPDATYKPEEHY